jgi:hypothetical protein
MDVPGWIGPVGFVLLMLFYGYFLGGYLWAYRPDGTSICVGCPLEQIHTRVDGNKKKSRWLTSANFPQYSNSF